MDPLNIKQAVSLSTLYAPKATTTGPTPSPQSLGGKSVEQGQDGVARAFRTKGTWDRFKSRTSHGFKQFKDVFSSKDQTADNRAVRFNARHEKFSGKVENLVARLVSGDRSDLESADVLATLRNDVKLLNRDAPWAKRDQILSSRLDIELSKLSDTDLAKVADSLKNADRSSLTAKDKADLDTMSRAVVRQQLVRSDRLDNLLGKIDHAAPSNLGQEAALFTDLDAAMKFVSDQLADMGVASRDNGRNEDILGPAVRMKLRQGDPARLPGMNRNLLNLERGLRIDAQQAKKNGEISTNKPELRVLSRAVRDEFLQGKVTDFQDAQLRSRLKVLGAGAAHQVTKGTYEKMDGTRESRVHKYDDEELVHPHGGRFAAPDKLGLDQTNPRLLERAVVTAKYDESLGFNVSVGTNFARHEDQVGIVMQLAPGSTASGVYGVTGNAGVAQREMIKLQLLDSLTGQADRHSGNYMVEVTNGEVSGIKAIDSDFCMGPQPGDPEDIVGRHGVHLPHLPPVVDKDMARAIRAMTHDDIERMCDNMFDDETVQAAKDRLDAVKDHLDKLEKEGNLIDPKDWGTDQTTKILTETTVTTVRDGRPRKEFTSYWQRDYPAMSRSPFEEQLGLLNS